MRTNRYSSAADARRQRRYERIQQRREEELDRRDRRGRDAEERIEDPFQQSELYAELLRRHLEEEQRRMREERERAMWSDFERWLRHQYEDSPVYKVIFEDVPAEYDPEYEPELSAGDSSALDWFLGNFLAPGA